MTGADTVPGRLRPSARRPVGARVRRRPTALDAGRAPRPVAAPLRRTLTGYRWPLAHGRITLPFGPTPWGSRVVDGKLFHDGVDLATFCGDRIVAAHGGKVLAAGRHFDEQIGWVGDLAPYFARLDAKHLWRTLPIVVVIDDGNGYRSIYAHFGEVAVKRGQTVKAGAAASGTRAGPGGRPAATSTTGCSARSRPRRSAIEPDVVKRMKVPRLQIARIDPLLVLPGADAAATRRRVRRRPRPTAPTRSALIGVSRAGGSGGR